MGEYRIAADQSAGMAVILQPISVPMTALALARRLAVIMHRIWVDGTEFRWTRELAAAAA
jgi:hypothetical protein